MDLQRSYEPCGLSLSLSVCCSVVIDAQAHNKLLPISPLLLWLEAPNGCGEFRRRERWKNDAKKERKTHTHTQTIIYNLKVMCYFLLFLCWVSCCVLSLSSLSFSRVRNERRGCASARSLNLLITFDRASKLVNTQFFPPTEAGQQPAAVYNNKMYTHDCTSPVHSFRKQNKKNLSLLSSFGRGNKN